MAVNNSIPAFGTLAASLSILFTNDSSAPVQIRMLKLTNNSASRRTLSVYLNSNGIRTPLLPEGFELNAGHMASDDMALTLRKHDSVEGVADVAQTVSFVIS